MLSNSARTTSALATLVVLAATLAGCGSSGPSATTVAIFKTQTPATVDQLNTIATIVRNRLAAYGVAGSTVAVKAANEVVVSIPGSKPMEQTLNEVSTAGHLSFRPGLCYAPAYSPGPGGTAAVGALPACSPLNALTAENMNPTIAADGNIRENSPTPDPQFAGYPSSTPQSDNPAGTVILPFEPGYSGYYQSTPRLVVGPAGVTNSAIRSATPQSQLGTWVVDVVLTDQGTTAWDNLARKQFHALIAIDLDGGILSAPVTEVGERAFSSFNGSVQIAGGFTQSSAKALAIELGTGALPVELTLTGTSVVAGRGPTG